MYSANATKIVAALYKKIVVALMGNSRFFGDVASNAIVLRVFNNWKLIEDKYTHQHAALRSQWLIFSLRSAKIDLVRITSFIVILAVCLGKTIFDVKNGRSSVGHFVMINAYVMQICAPFDGLARSLGSMAEAMGGLAPFFTIFNRPSTSRGLDSFQPGTLKTDRIDISLKGISFDYGEARGRAPITADLKGGTMTAIVGSTGAGKSTIARMILGLAQPSTGSILINDRDISTYSEDELYSLVAFVPQETYLFNDTIEFNIRIAKPDATNDQILAALGRAELIELIERLPDGLQTKVGDRGLMLSGGERQRIAIARALLRDSAILLLDEATSALDEATEERVLRAIKPTSSGRMVLAIAHRATAISKADAILRVVASEGSNAKDGMSAIPA
ncbi:protein of unknown function (plasmid) [Pararobbsia alpina]